MMKPRLFVVLALLLALGLASSVLAGPRNPRWGDPDIVEGIKTKGKTPREQVSNSPQMTLVLDIPIVGRIVFLRQEQREMPETVAKRLPAASRTKRIRK